MALNLAQINEVLRLYYGPTLAEWANERHISDTLAAIGGRNFTIPLHTEAHLYTSPVLKYVRDAEAERQRVSFILVEVDNEPPRPE